MTAPHPYLPQMALGPYCVAHGQLLSGCPIFGVQCRPEGTPNTMEKYWKARIDDPREEKA